MKTLKCDWCFLIARISLGLLEESCPDPLARRLSSSQCWRSKSGNWALQSCQLRALWFLAHLCGHQFQMSSCSVQTLLSWELQETMSLFFCLFHRTVPSFSFIFRRFSADCFCTFYHLCVYFVNRVSNL